MPENLFPVLELWMNNQGLKIRLGDQNTSLSVTLPKEMMEGIVTQWQAFQNGESPLGTAFSRHYTGEWPDVVGGTNV